MTAAGQQMSTVITDVVTVFSDNIAEEPELLESTDRVVDRIGTDPAETSTSIRRLDSDS